jgi:hypothetical protein
MPWSQSVTAHEAKEPDCCANRIYNKTRGNDLKRRLEARSDL